MAKKDKSDTAKQSTPVTGLDENEPHVRVVAQYVKDLSFENPNAPQTFQTMGNEKPKIDVSVNVNGKKVADDHLEVELKLSATASHGDSKAFVVELVFAGLFMYRNIPDEMLQPFILVQAPILLFPFARRIVADATRDGGYPPLLLDPIDFAALYQQKAQQTSTDDASVGEKPVAN